MSKRNNDGDVIANRISLLEAKGQKLLASLYGSRPDWDSVGSAAKTQNDDDDQDLKQNYAHDRIGLGGVLPKDIEDGSFTKRIPTSDDKLLQQLIGKRKAKAHIAAKQEAARSKPATKAQQYAKQNVAKKEESDEEEGRAATFKSKRQKKKEKQAPRKVDDDEEAEVAQPAPQRTKTKPKSFLDEILAERSKKKADKGK
ncbi:hypothetical protein A1F97_01454 [Pyrenophora tritici-repentis]|nr:repeatdomain containing protein [Pyrenophora tritici-repentis]KAI1553108.1 repeatdomain containing protein [Pyrenophora tritici-repentis]PZD45380.1 hypothetical protein A1F97_01454 [Pyrenophora tritici-repentis]